MKSQKDRVCLLVCLPRSICRCDRPFDCGVVLTVNLLKHVANGTRQGNPSDPIQTEHCGPRFLFAEGQVQSCNPPKLFAP